MVRCEKCSAENADTAQYCDECGARLNIATPNGAGSAASGGETNVARIGVRADVAMHQAASASPSAASSAANSSMKSNLMQSPYAKLVVQRGRSAGKEFTLIDDEVEIGRWDADGGIFPEVDLDADDPEAKVSRRHARIIRRNNEFFIEDLGSTNGTFINRGRRLLPGDRQPLRDGDEVIVGKMFLRFYVVS